MGRNNSTGNITQGDESSVTYADWNAYKKETVNRTLGISDIDVVMSFWTFNGGAIDGAEVDWTGITEVSVPAAPATLLTDWNKALDFGGSSERLQQVSNSTSYNPMMMGGLSQTVSAPSAGNTATGTTAHPWACTIVFNADGHNSNQHIWNVGEGAGSTDDNIYLRVAANRQLFFGWGRDGARNEVYIGMITAGTWYGLYVGHNGTRLSGNNPTPANLAECFDIHFVNLTTGVVAGNSSNVGNWTAADSTTGGRMDRSVTGNTTIGGRGANRSFHGKIASTVITTLRRGQAMPGTEEISKMVRDPRQWLVDYKIGQTYRIPYSNSEFTFNLNQSAPAYGTQVWLMGDGPFDGFAQIRNQVYPSIQNIYPMNMISMASNDIQTVNIPGLT